MPTDASAVTCPDCGEIYGPPDKLAILLDNNGYCVNLTCLADVSLALRLETTEEPSRTS